MSLPIKDYGIADVDMSSSTGGAGKSKMEGNVSCRMALSSASPEISPGHLVERSKTLVGPSNKDDWSVDVFAPSSRPNVVNPQLREDLRSSSEQHQEERIAEWVDRILEQRTDWPWDWGIREDEPAWGDDYQFPE